MLANFIRLQKHFWKYSGKWYSHICCHYFMHPTTWSEYILISYFWFTFWLFLKGGLSLAWKTFWGNCIGLHTWWCCRFITKLMQNSGILVLQTSTFPKQNEGNKPQLAKSMGLNYIWILYQAERNLDWTHSTLFPSIGVHISGKPLIKCKIIWKFYQKYTFWKEICFLRVVIMNA